MFLSQCILLAQATICVASADMFEAFHKNGQFFTDRFGCAFADPMSQGTPTLPKAPLESGGSGSPL